MPNFPRNLNVRVLLDNEVVLYVRDTRISSIIYGLRNNGPEPIRQIIWLVRYAHAIADCPSDVVCTIETQDWCSAVWVEYGDNAIRYFHDDSPAEAWRKGADGSWDVP